MPCVSLAWHASVLRHELGIKGNQAVNNIIYIVGLVVVVVAVLSFFGLR